MLQKITFQEISEARFRLLIESIRSWRLKKFSKKKENFFLIH